MDGHETTQGGIKYKRITKAQAKKAYNNGETIWLVPKHVRFDFSHQWVRPFEMNKVIRDVSMPDEVLDFHTRVRYYEWYNCCYELGTYACFYIRVEDQSEKDYELT